MKLSKEIKDLIRKEYKAFEDFMYNGKSKEERDELAQFFTPPEVSIKLIEELSSLSGTVLDPTSGSGNLLAAALIAGADSTKIFGNDYDEQMVDLCRDRLNNVIKNLNAYNWLNINDRPLLEPWQIHRGNALHEFALSYFAEDYNELYNADGYNRINHKNVSHIDNRNYDAYEEPAFKKAHPDLYANICKERADREKAKRAEELADIKEQYDDGDLSFLASFEGSDND